MEAFFVTKFRHVFWLLHRRAGKDKTCLNVIVAAACQRKGTYLYLFPQHNQARRVIWRGMDASGMRFIDHIPKELIAKINSTDMSIELINGSIIQLVGSDNYDALMGTNPLGIVYSEFSLHHPMARQLLNPILVENGGWEILQGTPRGKNHAYEVYTSVRHNPQWYVRVLTVEDTFRGDGESVITKAQVDEELAAGMPTELCRQEFYCDWNVGVVGAFYTEEIDRADKEDRIVPMSITKNAVWTFWDLGIADSTAIWFMQPNGGTLDMIYTYESTGKGIEHYIQVVNAFAKKHGINYKGHYAPHDIEQREYISARSRQEMARELGINFMVVPKVSIEDGIQACKTLFPRVRFHVEHAKDGLNALREYKREYDDIRRAFKDKPLHDWSSNYADAFRYFAVMWRNTFTRPDFSKQFEYKPFQPTFDQIQDAGPRPYVL